MKVLYLINYAGSGGSERYVELLAAYFHNKKCACGLCYNEHGALVEKMAALGIPTHRIVMRNPLDLAAARALAALCRDEGYEVIHAQYPRENYIAILSKLFGNRARVVFTSHLIIHQGFPWNWLNRGFTRCNHHVITVCRHGKTVLEQNGVAKDKIRVVYNGIDAGRKTSRDPAVLEEFGIRDDELVISILTRFSEEKGMAFLCDAVKRLKEITDVPFRVLAVGTGPLFDEIQAYARQLGIDDVLIMPGFRSDTAKLLAASDFYLNSSASEAMSFAILEAMGAGLPLVLTDVGGNPELVNTGEVSGLLVPYGDSEGYATAMKRLLEDAPLRERFGLASMAKAKREFDLHTLQDQVFALYQS